MRSLRRIDWLNGSAVIVALALAISAAAAPSAARRMAPSASTVAAQVVREPLGGGRYGLRDATGALIELRGYRRIAAGSLVADGVLEALCERDRIAAFSAHASDESVLGHRFAGTPSLPFDLNVERMLGHRIDLFVFNGISQAPKIEQLRRAGVTAFDLGDMRGVSTLLSNVRSVAELIGAPERGEHYAQQFLRRMRAIAFGVPREQRRTGMYVGMHGDQLFGGGRSTSYDDVLSYAGLVNAAAVHHEGWPRYTAEQVIAIDPDVIVTQDGMRAHLCQVFGLERIRACGPSGQIVELPAALLVNPGVVMLEAAEALNRAVYGEREPATEPATPQSAAIATDRVAIVEASR